MLKVRLIRGRLPVPPVALEDLLGQQARCPCQLLQRLDVDGTSLARSTGVDLKSGWAFRTNAVEARAKLSRL